MRARVWLCWILAATAAASASDALASGRERLEARYREIAGSLDPGSAAPAFSVDTRSEAGAARGDVYVVLNHDFRELSHALSNAASWCDIAPLHLNVKSCTWQEDAGSTLLTLYSGRKFYERPEDAYELRYDFQLATAAADYFRVVLSADEGPLGSRDYVLELSAIRLAGGTSFVHLGYAYRFGLSMRLALASYFATGGSGKVGFSVVGEDERGNPIYSDGLAGMVERNAVRYQLAIEAYLDTARAPAELRFEHRLVRWFDLTSRYHRQLFELEEQEYLESKRRERSDQLRLQRKLEHSTLRP